MKIIDVEQGTDEWFEARCGVVTASEFSSVMATGRGSSPSKTRKTYMLKKIGEQLTERPADSWGGNGHTERGHEDEPIARGLYEAITGNSVATTGLITTDCSRIGYSPDGLVGEEGLIEIKSKAPHRHIECILNNAIPPEHMDQLWGGLLVSERKWIDFVSYCEGLPLFIKRVNRDEKVIGELRIGIDNFLIEMEALKEKVMRYAA